MRPNRQKQASQTFLTKDKRASQSLTNLSSKLNPLKLRRQVKKMKKPAPCTTVDLTCTRFMKSKPNVVSAKAQFKSGSVARISTKMAKRRQVMSNSRRTAKVRNLHPVCKYKISKPKTMTKF